MANFFDKLFNVDKKRVLEIEKKVKPTESYAEKMASLTDEELKAKTTEFKHRLQENETLDDIMPEAFAVCREAAKRVIGEYPYFVQLMGACVMHGGDIAEMKTGEGKTLTSVMAVYLNALSGEGVHVVTVNEYLAERDSKWMGEIHRFLGLTVGLNKRELTPAQKKAAYACDITYTTNAEVGFDYLRDNMVTRVEDRVLRPLNFALVDEVDSILIDESRTPLIISGGQKQTANLYINADKFVKSLKEDDYEIDIKGKTVQLGERGVAKAEKAFGVSNLYDLKNTQLVHHLNQALKANYTMHNDVEYVVENDEIVIVDQFTGRKMPGRAYSDGLHQAIEAKEGVPIKQETTTLATITYQNFFRLYKKLAGMTGTAKTEEEEFLSIYNMRVIEIPTHRPIARIDYPDAVFGSVEAKFNALVNEVKELNEKGQPVLVGTISVETSEYLSKRFKQAGIKHNVLNAKNHEREADIIADAGKKYAVTIATNMAGRGTDIKLQEGVKELGGLAVLGSERHESRRIDNQLRGRSGRQGDVGFSRFYVSVKDELMLRFGSERFAALFASLGDVPIESKSITRAIGSAQKRVEGVNFDVRKTLLDYDDVLRQQREVIYAQRNFILENDDVHSIVYDMFKRVITNVVLNNCVETRKGKEVDVDSLLTSLDTMGFVGLTKQDLMNQEVEVIIDKCVATAWNTYEEKIAPFKEQILPIEKTMVLKVIDRAWINHIDTMSKLREGIHLRGYAQNNPLQEYVTEGYQMFEDMMASISSEVVTFCMNVKIEVTERKKK
ncbi:preprotein translocase subunit SecA [Erysipelotrichaceae bacterium OH741_COT-311]|nr:preprotein translocase subunit SecA [Erysipelotrichaceae bacterium OH741_COT-311]